jgi:hypothetical protein
VPVDMLSLREWQTSDMSTHVGVALHISDQNEIPTAGVTHIGVYG